MKTIQLKAFRSKLSKRYFKFEQYCDDGYGKYEDSINDYELERYGTIPSLFELDTTGRTFYEFKDHKKDEIEEVRFTIMVSD